MLTCPDCGRIYGKRKRCYNCVPAKRRTGVVHNCLECNNSFYVQQNQILNGEGKYCSYQCKYAAQRGKVRNLNHRYVRPDGYIAVKTKSRTYEQEHRVVMQQHLGRKLDPSEHIHHINGDKADNRVENLMVLLNGDHQRLHAALAGKAVHSYPA